MIEPTIGRVVYYFEGNVNPGEPAEVPQAATIAYVHDTRMVNLSVVNHSGFQSGMTSIVLVQPGDGLPSGPRCEWMPYQVKKDTGSESGEKAAGTEEI